MEMMLVTKENYKTLLKKEKGIKDKTDKKEGENKTKSNFFDKFTYCL